MTIVRLAIGIVFVTTACGRSQIATTPAAFHAEIARFDPSNGHVARAVAAAKAGRAKTFVFEVSTSIGHGCTCPPFAIGDGENPTYVMPAFGDLPDAEIHLLGRYRMRGRFDGREITAIQWRREAGKAYVAGESDYGWDQPRPAIVVEDWCFEPRWDSLESWEPRDWVVDELRSLRASGRICPGAMPHDGALVAAVRAPAP